MQLPGVLKRWHASQVTVVRTRASCALLPPLQLRLAPVLHLAACLYPRGMRAVQPLPARSSLLVAQAEP